MLSFKCPVMMVTTCTWKYGKYQYWFNSTAWRPKLAHCAPPPRLNNVKKNCTFFTGGHPLCIVYIMIVLASFCLDYIVLPCFTFFMFFCIAYIVLHCFALFSCKSFRLLCNSLQYLGKPSIEKNIFCKKVSQTRGGGHLVFIPLFFSKT